MSKTIEIILEGLNHEEFEKLTTTIEFTAAAHGGEPVSRDEEYRKGRRYEFPDQVSIDAFLADMRQQGKPLDGAPPQNSLLPGIC